MDFSDLMQRAERTESPLNHDDMPQGTVRLSGILHARLVGLTAKQSFKKVESTQGNGLEAWRLLSQRYNPSSYARLVSLILQVVVTWKIANNGDFQTGVL